MTAQKLLFVLVVEVLDDQEAADVIDKSVFVSRVVVDGISVATSVSDGVLHLNE